IDILCNLNLTPSQILIEREKNGYDRRGLEQGRGDCFWGDHSDGAKPLEDCLRHLENVEGGHHGDEVRKERILSLGGVSALVYVTMSRSLREWKEKTRRNERSDYTRGRGRGVKATMTAP